MSAEVAGLLTGGVEAVRSGLSRGAIGPIGVAVAAVCLGGAVGARAAFRAPSAASVYDLTSSPSGTTAGSLDVGASLYPGARVDRIIDLDNVTGRAVGTVQLSVRATSATDLTSDRRRGVQLRILECTSPVSGNTVGHACAAPGDWIVTTPPGPATGTRTLRLAAPLRPDETAHLKLLFSLPVDSPSSMQGEISTLDYAFLAPPTAP